jgi:hypothetical protein
VTLRFQGPETVKDALQDRAIQFTAKQVEAIKSAVVYKPSELTSRRKITKT